MATIKTNGPKFIRLSLADVGLSVAFCRAKVAINAATTLPNSTGRTTRRWYRNYARERPFVVAS